ncbi:MAG: TIGR04086 family membrane protein [Bacilli bacterium]|nr:TIGR04086 family membrane protein [Bacilli bacterium]
MEYLKKTLKSLLYVLVPILVVILLLTILNYFGIISYKVLNILKYITLIISILIGSYNFGNNSKSNGWLEGLKFGGIIVVILLLFNYLVFNMPFTIKAILYYGIVLGISILGSIFGINKRKEK